MIRRSRISVRPNVRPGGRGLSSSSQEPKPAGEAPPGSPKAQEKRDVAGREPQDEALKAGSESSPPPPPLTEDARAEQQASLNQEEKNHNEKASGSSIPTATPIQRRKRISAMPNLAKPRTAQPQARTPRPATSGTAKIKEPIPKDSTVLENTSPQALPKSPGRRRASTGPQQLKVPDKRSGNLKEVKTAPASQEPAADSNRSRNDETQQTHDGSSSKLKTSQDSFCIDDHRPSPEYSPGKLKASQNDICIDDHLPHPEYSQGKLKASQNDICIDDHHPHPEYSQGKLKDSQNSTCIEEKQRRPESSLPLKKSTASSDRERIIKARKLRELLKKEIRKEKKQQKGKTPDFEFNAPVDRSKMTMRDFIYYLPENNPMKSSLEEERREIEKVIGPMPSKEPANKAPLPPPVRDEDEDDNEEEDVEHVQEDQVLVPRVKVAEDGSIIIDEESLTVEVLRMQGPNVVEENDPVFERGSTTTYSSFRKSTHTKPWTNRETDMFFLAISMVGTDFSIIGQLFPHRARVEIKNKFKREERENSWRIDKAFREKRPFDFEFFSQLLERILKDDERKRLNKKKVTLGKKPANPKRRKKEKKADQDKAPDGGGSVEVSDSEVAEGEADAETAEKENEDSLNVNEGEASTAGDPDAKKKRKRKKNDAESGGPATKKPSEDSSERQQKKAKKRKRIKSVEICEDSEEVDYENMPPLEESPGSSPCRREDSDTPEVAAQIKKQQIAEEEDVSGPAEETAGPEAAETPKLAQRSRLQKPKPCLKLATKRGAKAAVDKPNELSQASHFISHEQAAEPHCIESAIEGTAASHLKRSTTRDQQPSSDIQEIEEDEHDITAIQKKMLHKPTRSGRIPKLSLHLKQPEDDEPPAASPPASPPSETASPQRRGRGRPPQSQKPKPSTLKGRDQKKDPRPGKTALVTLRASVKETEENSDEEGESVMEEEGDSFSMNPEEVNQAPAFVPVSLRSPAPVPAQVEETMEELELSVGVPDTRCTIEPEHLHHSDSVCSQSLDQSPVEAAVTENCLHSLVDVIEVSTPEKDEDNSLPVNDSNTDSDRSCLAVRKDLLSQPSSAAGPGDNGSGVSEEPPCQALKPGLVEVEKAATVSQDSMQPAHSQAVTCEATTQVLHEAPSETPSEETAGSVQAFRDPCTLDEAANTIGVVNAPEVSHGSETLSQNQERGRRSRFPKPKPNLGGKTAQPRSLKTKTPQSDSGQDSCGDASRKAEVHIVQQKPAEEKESEVDSCKDEGVSKELREVKASSLSSSEEGLRKDGTNIVVNAPEVSHGSETPSQNQERGRRSRFPKPKPNLGGKTAQPRSLKTKPPQSDSGQDSCGGASISPTVDIAPHCPVDEKKCDSSRDEGVPEKLGDKDSSSSAEGLKQDDTSIRPALESLPKPTGEDERVEKRPAKAPLRRPKPNLSGKLRSRIPPEKDASAAASTGQEQNAIPEGGTVSTLDSPVSKKAEVRSPKADEHPSTSVISQNTEGSLAVNEFPQQEPTFILTLFEISPSLVGEYDDSTSSLSTISAELLSSPVFVDHVPAELPETQSLVSEAVEVESYSMSGCTEDAGIVSLDQFSQPVYRSGEEEKPKELPATSAHVKDLTTDLGDEEYVSITLEPVEDFPAAAEADSAETSSDAAQQTRQKNKPPGRARRGKLQVKPNTLKKKPPVSTGARGALKVVHIEPQERPLPAETASCTHLPQPAEQQTTQERPLPAETASCTPLPQPAEQQTTQEECSQHEGKEASNSSVKTAEPSIENIGAGEHLTPSTPNTLPPSGTPLIRPGRKPKGSLSFISQKSSSGNAPKPHRTTSQKPQINTARLDRKRTASAPAVALSSESSAVSPPSAGIGLCASSSSTPAAEGVGSTSSHLIHFPMTESCSSEPHVEEVFCTKNSAADEEPTSISQYFFSDIFTEVDDPD